MSHPEQPDPTAVPPQRCPYCSAANPRGGPTCWMCHAKLPFGQAKDGDDAGEDTPHFAAVGLTFSLATLMAIMTLVAVGVGLSLHEPGLGILFAVIAVPALIITVTRTRNEKRVKGRDVGLLEKVLTFLVSSLVVFSVFAAAQLALVIALFIVCLIICGVMAGTGQLR